MGRARARSATATVPRPRRLLLCDVPLLPAGLTPYVDRGGDRVFDDSGRRWRYDSKGNLKVFIVYGDMSAEMPWDALYCAPETQHA